MIVNIECYYSLGAFNAEAREAVLEIPNVLSIHTKEIEKESGAKHTLLRVEVSDSLNKLDMYQLGFDLAQKTSTLIKPE